MRHQGLLGIALLALVSTSASGSRAASPPVPKTVVTAARAIDNTFACAGSMECAEGRALTGERDGTGCGIANEGQCSTIKTLDEVGDPFSDVSNVECEPLPAFACGEQSSCPAGKVLVGYSDGTGCGVRNTGKCCRLVTKKERHRLVPTSCYWQNPVGCGTRTQCAADQVMIGRLDGTGCGVPSKIQCCNLEVQ